MGERVSPAAGDRNDDPTETYVVQIPRDQIYRVPPPENAHIVESYQKPFHDNRNKCGGRWILLFLAIMLVGIGIFVANNILGKPKSPEFSITHLRKKNLKSSNHHSNIPEYEISLQVSNPNENMEVHYGVGKVTLNFKGHKIANGGCPLIQQGAGKSMKVVETLKGTKEALPGWVEKSMKDKIPMAIILKIDVPIEIKTWGKILKKELIVGCDLQVNTLAEGAKIISQKCGTNF